jgi:1,4-alpha-glucan branching enzyme
MMKIDEQFHLLEAEWPSKQYEHVDDKLLVFERAGLIFVFNFDPNRSYEGRNIPCSSGQYSILLTTDSASFGGFDRIDESQSFTATEASPYVKLYIPCRCALVLKRRR